MVIIEEFKLIEIERSLAMVMNIPIKDYDVLSKIDFVHPSFMPAQMDQWRILFYFNQIEIQNAEQR